LQNSKKDENKNKIKNKNQNKKRFIERPKEIEEKMLESTPIPAFY